MNTSQQKLDALAQEIIDRDVCSELRSQPSRLVMGDGNPDADIVFIGEAPGKKEDEQGRPFVGPSGTFLNTMLQAANLSRDDVYITNVVKYRPPNNRDPSAGEVAEFLPYLLRQLEIINPKVVITLGRISMEHFLPDVKISDVHGQVFEVDFMGREVTFAPLYHPAVALRNGSMRAELTDDLVKVVETISSLPIGGMPYNKP